MADYSIVLHGFFDWNIDFPGKNKVQLYFGGISVYAEALTW